jgi:hypothetical protein
MWIGGDGDNNNGTRELVLDPPHRTIVEIAWLLARSRAPVGFKVCLADSESCSCSLVICSWNDDDEGVE